MIIPEWVWGSIFVVQAFFMSIPVSFFLAVWYINRRIRQQTERAQGLLQQLYRNQMH